MSELVIVIEQIFGALVFGVVVVLAFGFLVGAMVSIVAWQVDRKADFVKPERKGGD